MIHRHLTKRRVRWSIGFALAAGLLAQGYQSWSARTDEGFTSAVAARPSPNQAFAAPSPREKTAALTLEQMAAADPVGFLEMALDRYDRGVRDYTCTFTKQELVIGRMTERQVMEVQFRESPLSVRMKSRLFISMFPFQREPAAR